MEKSNDTQQNSDGSSDQNCNYYETPNIQQLINDYTLIEA